MSCYKKEIEELLGLGKIIVTPFIPSMSGGMMYRVALGYGTPLYSAAQGKGYDQAAYTDDLGLTGYSTPSQKLRYGAVPYGIRPSQSSREYGGPPLKPTWAIPESGGLEEKLPQQEPAHEHEHPHVHPEHFHAPPVLHVLVPITYEPSKELEELAAWYKQQKDLENKIKQAKTWTTTNVLSVPKV